ncbi:Alg9-like mannosyltransferase family isoform 1 [Hibiscus syriacus]|uniref:Alg9-like mannosyltransferase family isoform 1 n=1 Tax=Hibiscus syriacus TaxID=106335 RepID=A0A6A3C8V0_HIBSY|nr:pollen allergen Che a 1-like [Hibiscus syriacus]KAE8723479.1 Alg9-like mannosyltransferase family isoform 1 [Hibiscus syriacus]
MAKVSQIALFSLAICLSSVLDSVSAAQVKFIVEGKVYCDTCRVEFETRISEPLKGALVNLECRNRTNGTVTTITKDVLTDDAGAYKIEVEGDHAEEICEVSLVKSPRDDCRDPTEAWRKSRVVMTSKDGIEGIQRFANNLGFKKREPLSECTEVLKEMGYYELQGEEGHSYIP